MSIFKRVSATIGASVEGFVSRVENHDAIIQQGIRECREAIAKTRVHLKRAQRDNEKLKEQLAAAIDNSAAWKRRAVESLDDEEKALNCLKRKQQCESNVVRLQKSIDRQDALEARIRENLEALEQRHEEISRQRNEMRSRETTAQVQRITQYGEHGGTMSLDDVFERWEVNVIEAEVSSPSVDHEDVFESGFIQSEERSELVAQLDELKSDRGN